MVRLRHEELWRPARDIPFLTLCAAVVLSMMRSVDQPSVAVHLAGTDVSFVPADIALAALAVLAASRLLGRGSLPRPARAVTAAAAIFAVWLIVSSAANGGAAFVGAGKLLEYGLLGLGAVLFVQRRGQLWLLAGLLVALTAAADAYALLAFFNLPPLKSINPGQRQASFLGQHDYAALASMSLVLGLAALYVRTHRLGKLPLVGAVTGAIGVTLGAAMAGLVGLWLAIAAIVGLALVRRAVTLRALVVTALVAGAVSAGSIALRGSDLGFLREWLGNSQNALPGQYAGSWSQRLIYAYIGGRIFLDNPIVGTGWYGELPPSEFARYLPDARRRFSDQPANYFPSATGDFTPQQTYDQILYELGIVGALLFLALAVVTVRTVLRVGTRWPRGSPDELAAYLPTAWTGALAGGLAGAALFGGVPQTAIFWLTLGLAALMPSLVPPEPVEAPLVERRELAAALR